jgi:hypothetical protein
MKYPDGFPEHLKNQVEAALSEAEIEFTTRRKEAATWEPIQIEVLIKRYIRTVMFALADAACTAVEARIWTGENFRQAFNEYQYGLTEYVWAKKHPRPFDKSSMIDLRLAALTQIEESGEWIAIQERLKLAAQSPKSRFKALREQTESLLAKSIVPFGESPLPVAHPVVAVEPKSIGERLDDVALVEDISHEEQAHRIGIGRTTYFEVKSGGGGRKARQKTENYLATVLSEISMRKPD